LEEIRKGESDIAVIASLMQLFPEVSVLYDDEDFGSVFKVSDTPVIHITSY